MIQAYISDTILSPIGAMFVGATRDGVCILEFVDRRMLERELSDLQRRLNAHVVVGDNNHTIQAKQELDEYFTGKRTSFDVRLDLHGTPFQLQAWEALQNIAYGRTVSYQEQANKLNNPNAVRAVASANGHNRIAIIVPCHRVIGKNGNLTGYRGGLERKQWLLNHEKRHSEQTLF